MSQEDVYNFLKKNLGKKFTCKQIAESINISIVSVQNSVNKLEKCNDIYSTEIDYQKGREYNNNNCNRKVRLFFIKCSG